MGSKGGNLLSIVDDALLLSIYYYADQHVSIRVAGSIRTAGVGEPADTREILGPLEDIVVVSLIIGRNHVRERKAFGVDDIGNDLAGHIRAGLVVIPAAVIFIKHHISTRLAPSWH